jgi:hypothetical protein
MICRHPSHLAYSHLPEEAQLSLDFLETTRREA